MFKTEEKSMGNYISFWKGQSDSTRCLAILHPLGLLEGELQQQS